MIENAYAVNNGGELAPYICVVAPHKPNACAVQATAYGSCLQRIVPDIEQGACEKEFASLKVCWRAAFRASLKATQR